MQIQAKGGHRLNPSPREFGLAYRAVATNMLMTSIPSSNYRDDGDELLSTLGDLVISHQNYSKQRKKRQDSRDEDDAMVPQTKRQRTDTTGSDGISTEDFDSASTSAVDNVIAYIGGYMIKKLKGTN